MHFYNTIQKYYNYLKLKLLIIIHLQEIVSFIIKDEL